MQVLVAKFNSINDCIGFKELHYLRELQNSSNSTAPLAYRCIGVPLYEAWLILEILWNRHKVVEYSKYFIHQGSIHG